MFGIGVCSVARVLRALCNLRGNAKGERNVPERKLAFFRKHSHRMPYHALKEENIAIGLGVGEAGCRSKLVGILSQSQMRAAKYVERQITVALLAVEEATFLMAVQRVVGGVEVEPYLPREVWRRNPYTLKTILSPQKCDIPTQWICMPCLNV